MKENFIFITSALLIIAITLFLGVDLMRYFLFFLLVVISFLWVRLFGIEKNEIENEIEMMHFTHKDTYSSKKESTIKKKYGAEGYSPYSIED